MLTVGRSHPSSVELKPYGKSHPMKSRASDKLGSDLDDDKQIYWLQHTIISAEDAPLRPTVNRKKGV